MSAQARTFSSQFNEHRLGYILRQGGVAARLAKRGRLDEINVPSRQLGEGVFRAFLSVAA
jgi:hypothetical protein